MKGFRILRLCALGAALVAPTEAATITDITLVNDSSPDFTETLPGESYREFRTASTTPSAAAQSGLTSTFTNRMAWFHGYQVTEAGASLPQLFSRSVEYSLEFRVEDPRLSGYSLDFDTVFHGLLTAESGKGNFGFTPFVFSAGTLMAANYTVDGGPPMLANVLATPVEVATASDVTPQLEEAVSATRTYSAGTFFGTHVFKLVFSTLVSNASAGISNYNWGEATGRFGLEALGNTFAHGDYPAGGVAQDEHGHFVTVTVTSLAADSAEVPEPGSFALAALGIGLAVIGYRRRSNTGETLAS